jgi:hypothetical protein
LKSIGSYVIESKEVNRDEFLEKYKIIEKNSKTNPESFLDVLYVIKASGKNKWFQYIKLLIFFPYYYVINIPFNLITGLIIKVFNFFRKKRK